MERQFRASSSVNWYIALLTFDAIALVWDAFNRYQDGATFTPILWISVAIVCAVTGANLYLRWGRSRCRLDNVGMELEVDGVAREIRWADVAGIREFRGPALGLHDQGLLVGPFLPVGMLAGERVLEIIHRPGQRTLIRDSLIEGYGALRGDVLRFCRDAEVNMNARYWRAE